MWSNNFFGYSQVCFKAARFCWSFFSALVTILGWHAAWYLKRILSACKNKNKFLLLLSIWVANELTHCLPFLHQIEVWSFEPWPVGVCGILRTEASRFFSSELGLVVLLRRAFRATKWRTTERKFVSISVIFKSLLLLQLFVHAGRTYEYVYGGGWALLGTLFTC